MSVKKATKRKVDDKMEVSTTGDEKPFFLPVKKDKLDGAEIRRISVPTHRVTPLKENWLKIFNPIVENLHLQIRYKTKARQVEIRKPTPVNRDDDDDDDRDVDNLLQKAADFVRAFVFGFEVEDALALLRLDDLFLDSFDIRDVRAVLKGDHLSRAVGRVAGKGGKIKYTLENVTRTRIVLADTKVHILGSYQNIQVAKRGLSNLIMGSPPSKVYGMLRNYAARSSERF